jgi:peptidoglycan-N-acetylglucosamine deacetylase
MSGRAIEGSLGNSGNRTDGARPICGPPRRGTNRGWELPLAVQQYGATAGDRQAHVQAGGACRRSEHRPCCVWHRVPRPPLRGRRRHLNDPAVPAHRTSLLYCALLALLGCATTTRRQAANAPQLAITMDDLPVHGTLPPGETRASVGRRLLAAFTAAGVPEVYGFVNGFQLEREPGSDSALSAWTAAGYPLGNHTWSHRNLNQTDAQAFELEIVRNEATLRRFGGGELRKWLRFPYLVEGRDAAKRDSVRAALVRRGYRIAAVTMDYSDWQWNDAYVRCLTPGKEAGLAALESAYLENVREASNRSRTLSRALYGREIPYVLLTHISAFNARTMPRVLDVYRQEGFRFTTLEAAQQDSVYRRDMDPSQPAGPASLEARARQRGLPIPPRTDRSAMLSSACR